MAEIKRGMPFPRGFPTEEARLVGPYPVFKAWWGRVRSDLSEQMVSALSDVDLGRLHEFYVLRRRLQKQNSEGSKEILEELENFWKKVESKDESFYNRNEFIIGFIASKTGEKLTLK